MSNLGDRLDSIILFLVTLVSFLIFYVSYQTTTTGQIPFEVISGKTEAHRHPFGVSVNYQREFIVNFNSEVTVYRTVKHLATGVTFDIIAPVRIYKTGRYKTNRSFILPNNIPDGEWIHETVIVWRPLLSLVDKSAQVTSFTFILCGKTILCEDAKNKDEDSAYSNYELFQEIHESVNIK